MRILLHAPPPWAHSGYGHQARFAAHALASLGHDVAISAYAGVHEERPFEGIPVLGTGGKPYGNGVIAGNYRRWDSDLLITITDLFTLDPAQMNGLNVMPVVPVDCQPLGVMEQRWLGVASQIATVHPVAMSTYGAAELAAHGYQAPVVPHATALSFSAEARGKWRKEHKVPENMFLVVKVGVNNEDDRKSFEVTMLAFEEFTRQHKKAGLFLHTEPQAAKSPNLAMMAISLGLKNRVIFPGEYERGCDLYDQEWMRGLYSAADVLDAATKGEGFGCPVIDALACGTPVIGCRNSAVTEKISAPWGWLVNGQRTWARHHNAWWVQPRAAELARAYHKAAASASRMRGDAAAAGARWSPTTAASAWEKALEGL